MTILDTSVLVGCFTGERQTAPLLRNLIEDGERAVVPTLVLYEWFRGPRTAAELQAQEEIFPSALALAFGTREAVVSAKLYLQVKRARGREVDIAIAAHALVQNAAVWTLNIADFKDIPGLVLRRL